jgi:hypothetical protein
MMPPSMMAIAAPIMRTVIAIMTIAVMRLIIITMIIGPIIDRLVIRPVIIAVIWPVIITIMGPVIRRRTIIYINLRMAAVMMPFAGLCRTAAKDESHHRH